MKNKSAFLLVPALLLSSALFAQAPGAPKMGATPAAVPMTEKEVINELKKDGADQLQKDLASRGVAFETDADVEKRLRKAKATDEVVKAVTAAGPKERAAAAKTAAMAGGGLLISPAESADFKALQTELDPDKAIAMVEDYVKKYPKSDALSYVYAFEANAYQTKGDANKIVEYAEKSLELKKDNLMSLLMVAYSIPQPQFLSHQTDQEKQLTLAETYAQAGFKAIDDLKKGPTEQDADFAKRKTGYAASLHSSMGMIHLDRAQLGLMGLDKEELAKAEKEYNLAISLSERPEATDYFRLGEACRLQGKVDDAIAAFTKASDFGQGVVKQYADQQIATLKKFKEQSGSPAKH